MTKQKRNPLTRLKHHVTGAIERGEAVAIEAVTETKHAPWTLEEHKAGPQVILNSKGEEIARTSGITNDVDEDLEVDGYADDKKNARKIAAAPELLEALEYIIQLDEHNEPIDEGDIKMIKAVINKARGGSHE